MAKGERVHIDSKHAAGKLGALVLSLVLVAACTMPYDAVNALADEGSAYASAGDSLQADDSVHVSSVFSKAVQYAANVTADAVASSSDLLLDSEATSLLTDAGEASNDGGSAGVDDAVVVLTGTDHVLERDIEVDAIGTLDLYLLEGSTFIGTVSVVDGAEGLTADHPVTVNIDRHSTWIVTGDSTISNLNAETGAAIVDENGLTASIVVGDKTSVEGKSPYVVTVTGSFTGEVAAGVSR